MEDWLNILQYDIKEYLRLLIVAKKQKNPQFSQRAFAYQLGFSPSTLNEIIKGKRRLTKKSIEKLKKGLAEDQDLQKYLAVHGNEKFSTFHKISREFVGISRWYHQALLELTETEEFIENVEWISRRLGISTQEAQKALDDLTTIGELKRNQSGRLVANHQKRIILSSEEQAKVLAQLAQDEVAKLGQCLHELPPEERFFTTVIAAMDPADFEYIRTRMIDSVREYCEYLYRDGVHKTEVYHLGFSCISLTKKN